MSIIRYKFKSSKDYDVVTFEGNSMPLWELKDEIISAKKLKSTEFDMIISNASTNEDYKEDSAAIPKNTSVIVRRVPKSSVGPRHQTRPHLSRNKELKTEEKPVFHNVTSKSSELKEEEEKIKKMASASSQIFSKQLELQESFGQDKQKPHLYATNLINPASGRPPPSTYVCYRCGEKGHYIADCPLQLTNPNDTTRIKRVTGIPKSFLKPAEGSDLKKTMISYDGSRVVYRPNQYEWERFHSLVGEQKSNNNSIEVSNDTNNDTLYDDDNYRNIDKPVFNTSTNIINNVSPDLEDTELSNDSAKEFSKDDMNEDESHPNKNTDRVGKGEKKEPEPVGQPISTYEASEAMGPMRAPKRFQHIPPAHGRPPLPMPVGFPPYYPPAGLARGMPVVRFPRPPVIRAAPPSYPHLYHFHQQRPT